MPRNLKDPSTKIFGRTIGDFATELAGLEEALLREASTAELISPEVASREGTLFYNDQLADSVRDALVHTTTDEGFLTMPELIAAKISVRRTHRFWTNWLTAYTEENIGIDVDGVLGYGPNAAVLMEFQGGGILRTPERIETAITKELTEGSAPYTTKEWNDLLRGKLPDGKKIPIYTIEKIIAGIPALHRQYAIVMKYSDAQATRSGHHTEDDFASNKLVIARAGGSENLRRYHALAKSEGTVGNWHPFAGRDATTCRGRLLYLGGGYYGLDGKGGLGNVSRLVGVAPEARGARKK